jgi:mannose-6-phosphate isomerase-like protein (cupin superfamily)
MMRAESAAGFEAYTWSEAGYRPLVFSHDWQAALLNWQPDYDLEKATQVERHNATDEVFVLIQGRAVLICAVEDALEAVDMQPGAIYNVRQGTWHALVATRDARWVIVENRDTHLHDCEFRRITEAEMSRVRAGLPGWVGSQAEGP